MSLPQLPQDKANHHAYGSWIAFVAFLIGCFILPQLLQALAVGFSIPAWLFALAVLVAFAVGKEALDWTLNQRAIKAGLPPPHGVELYDALATIAGGLPAVSVAFLLR